MIMNEPSSFWRDPPGSTMPEGSKRREFVDSRGPRFGASITTVVLAVVLITAGVSHLVAGWLLFAQTLIFAVGALAGLRYAPYGLIFRHLVRPRLGPPSKTEPEAPPRFSQGVGMVFAGIGAIGFAAGVPLIGIVFAAFALAAAFLNAAFDYCLGCQMYLLIQRIRPAH
jgi:Domain of unknown function (DUF4395)